MPDPLDSIHEVTQALPDHETKLALRDMVPLPPTSPKSNEDAPPVSIPIDLGDETFVDPVLQPQSTKAAAAPKLIRNFDGIAQSGSGGPPDPVGDVGLRHYVQAVNGAFAVWEKSGRKVFGPASLATLWRGVGGPCRYLGRGDPIVQYDALANRWLISEFAFALDPAGRPSGPFYQCIALSRSGHPMGKYHLYPFMISRQHFPDYPKFGVWSDAYYMTVHLFDPAKGIYRAQGVYAFDRVNMIEGRAAEAPIGLSNDDFFGVLPADVDGKKPPPEGAPNYLVAVEDNAGSFPVDQLEVFEFHVRWDNHSGSSLTSSATLPTAAFDTNLCYGNINCIPQLGTTRRLDPLGEGVLMYRLAYRNFGDFDALVLNNVVDVDGSDHAGIRWYELRGLSSDPRIHQQGTYSPDDRHRWMGSVAMDHSGNIAMGYSVSGYSMFPAIRYAARLTSDPLGELTRGEADIMQGSGSQTASSRWGDYSSLAVDPSDDCTFWYTSEYYRNTSPDSWRTRIGSFRFEACGPNHEPSRGESMDPPAPAVPTGPPPPSGDPAPEITAVKDTPDPFSPNGDGTSDKVRVSFDISQPARVTVMIKDRSGHVVRKVADASLTPGSWFAIWAGANSKRGRVPAGTYAYVIRAVGDGGSDMAEGTVTLQR